MTYIQPLLSIFFAIAFLGWSLQRKARGSAFVLVGLAGLFLLSWPPVDWLLSRPLEMWYPAETFRSNSAQAIVVFASGVNPPAGPRPYPLADDETAQRCEYAAWLYRHGHSVPVLACGGRSRSGGEPFSWTMRRELESFGVPADRVWVEDRSRSTHENALFGAAILRQHGITSVALVVSAGSMPRAAASLRKTGIRVTPAPSDFRDFRSLDAQLIPSWKAIRENEETLHEAGGLLWYWLRGWI